MQLLKAASASILLTSALIPAASAATSNAEVEVIDAELARLFPANRPGAAVLVIKDGEIGRAHV